MRTVISPKDISSGNVAMLQPQAVSPAPQPAAQAGQPAPAAAPPIQPDDFTARLVKYVPSDVIAVYVAVFTVLGTVKGEAKLPWLEWVVFAIIVALTPLYLHRVGKVGKLSQVIISTVALVIWAFAYGKPFDNLGWYDVYGLVIAGILLPLYTFGVAIING